jgi:hypothetical protein
MIFVTNIKTPANTPQTNPIITPIDIISGTITLVSIQFPPGVNALAHLKLLWGLYQIFPSNEQGDFSTGGETITWDENITIDAEPLQLKAITWNEDTQYDHTISVRIVMQPLAPAQSISNVLAALQPQQVESQQG